MCKVTEINGLADPSWFRNQLNLVCLGCLGFGSQSKSDAGHLAPWFLDLGLYLYRRAQISNALMN